MDKAPLNFLIPMPLRYTRREEQRIPADQQLVLCGATPWLMSFGTRQENNILQQVFTVPGTLLVLLTVRVRQYIKLQVVCDSRFIGLQYTLKGFAFGRLNGYGCLPLFEDTYTLQYIPEGMHEVLFAPGEYHYLYLVPGRAIETLAVQDPCVAQLSRLVYDGAAAGRLGWRLPMLGPVKDLLYQVLRIEADAVHPEYVIAKIILSLLHACQEQVLQKQPAPGRKDYNAQINTIVANHMHLPVPELIKHLRASMYVETATLRNIWLKHINKHTPRQHFKALRMEKGLYHLTLEGLSVKETAALLNFKNASTFSILFKKYFGVGPSFADSIFYR